MPYTPDALDDTQPNGATVPAKTAAAEFRAIKTVLIAHEEAITDTIPAALAGLDVRLDSYEATTSLRNRQWLTGSGNFTVPAGVTSLQVSLRGGGVDGVTLVNGTLAFNTLWARGAMSCAAGETDTRILTVTPGDVIAYSVGINGVYTIPSSTDTRFTETAATDTTFGAVTAKCAQGVYEGGVGIANYPNRSLVAYTRDDYPANPAASRALLSATAVKASLPLNVLTVTQYPSPKAFILVEW